MFKRVIKTKALHEMMGQPDAMQGHGYFKISNSPLNRNRQSPAGYPYKPEDFIDFDDQDDIDDDYVPSELARSKKMYNKTGRSSISLDLGTGNIADRRSFTSSNNNWIPSTPVFGEAKTIDEMSSSIRLRSKSSEPGVGTEYGWSKQPMWPEPQKKSSNNLHRYKDVVVFINNPATIPNVSDIVEENEEIIIREFIKLYLSNII